MTETFTADAIGAEIFEGALIAGIGSNDSGRYVMFQGTADDPDDPDGIWFEFDDQVNGGYNSVDSVHISGDLLTIELKTPVSGVQRFSITLAASQEEHADLRSQLARIYQGYPGVLRIQGA